MTHEPNPANPVGVWVLVFNFFAGIKARGIPVYASELEECFGRVGAHYRELRAPAWMARAPAWLQNAGFVFYEQIVAPFAARWNRCQLTVYPYNSASVLDALAGRSVLVIHDLIPNRRDSRGLAAWYVQISQAWHVRLGRPIATVSRHTMRQLGRIGRFRRCEKYLWANPFYRFEAALSRQHPPLHRTGSMTLLLCSGVGSNKDYRGALKLLRGIPPTVDLQVRVLGFGDEAHLARRRLDLLPDAWRERISVLPRLSLDQTVAEYVGADLVWVHSTNEGFGRPVMEARMTGRPVVASDIGAFRQLRRFKHIHFYREGSFDRALAAALLEARRSCHPASATSFNRQLEDEVKRLLGAIT